MGNVDTAPSAIQLATGMRPRGGGRSQWTWLSLAVLVTLAVIYCALTTYSRKLRSSTSLVLTQVRSIGEKTVRNGGATLGPSPTVLPPCSPGCIKRDTFVCLLQSRGMPHRYWLARAKWRNTAVISLAWRENVTGDLMTASSPSFRAIFLPNSTWTSGRNKLHAEALHMEKEQRWRFEFFVYFDEDAALSYRLATTPHHVVVHRNDDMALRKLMDLLLRDRPMRAGIGFNPSEDLGGAFTRENFGCVRKCHMDPIVSAYHRTAVELLLPYSVRFDNMSWYASGIMSDLFASAVFPSFCHVYQEVLVELSQQLHHEYPKHMDMGLLFGHVNTCLSAALFRDYARNTSVGDLMQRLTPGMGYHSGLHMGDHYRQVNEYQCTQHTPGVNFTEKLGSDIAHLWRDFCL